MAFFLILPVLLVALSAGMMWRNNWVYHRRVYIIDFFYDHQYWTLTNMRALHGAQDFGAMSYFKSYEYMIFHFWIGKKGFHKFQIKPFPWETEKSSSLKFP